MKYFSPLSALVVVVALFAGTANAQLEISIYGQTNARVVAGIALVKTADLDFSEIVSNGSGGTVTIAAVGAAYNGVNAYPGSKAPQIARFQVRGQADKHYAAQVPAEIAVRNENGGMMTVNGFTLSSQEGNVLNTQGQDLLTVGATLHVNPDQEAGYYRGEFRVTINYN